TRRMNGWLDGMPAMALWCRWTRRYLCFCLSRQSRPRLKKPGSTDAVDSKFGGLIVPVARRKAIQLIFQPAHHFGGGSEEFVHSSRICCGKSLSGMSHALFYR